MMRAPSTVDVTDGVGVYRGAASVGWVRAGTVVRVVAAGVALLVGVAGCASSVSTADYQGLLTGFELSVQSPIDRLVAAKSVDEDTSARSELAAAMHVQEQALQVRKTGKPPTSRHPLSGEIMCGAAAACSCMGRCAAAGAPSPKRSSDGSTGVGPARTGPRRCADADATTSMPA
jgi:hypothetical protein